MAQNDYQFQDVNLQVTQWSHFNIFKFGSGHFFKIFFLARVIFRVWHQKLII